MKMGGARDPASRARRSKVGSGVWTLDLAVMEQSARSAPRSSRLCCMSHLLVALAASIRVVSSRGVAVPNSQVVQTAYPLWVLSPSRSGTMNARFVGSLTAMRPCYLSSVALIPSPRRFGSGV